MSKVKGIEQRSRGFYAVRDVPRPLQDAVGKRRLVRSLKTRDLHVAKARNYAAQADFQREIEAAERGTAASIGLEAGLAWRKTLDALRDGDPALIKQWGRLDPGPLLGADGRELELSEADRAGVWLDERFAEEVYQVGEQHGAAEAATMRGIAEGTATPMLLHLDAWVTEGGAKGDLTSRTKRQYRSDLAAFEDWCRRVGVGTIEDVGKKLAGRYVSEALLGTGTNRTTTNRKVSAVSAYWRWLVKRGHVEANPWTGQSVAKRAGAHRSEAPKRPFTTPEMVALFSGERLKEDRELADAMTVAALTGMRVEEVYRLTVADCAEGWFTIRRAKSDAGRRRVPVHPDLLELVEARTRGKTHASFLFHEAGPARPDGERSAALSKRFGRYRQTVGVHERDEGQRHSRVDFHSLRRWFVTTARNAGIDATVVAAVVGHEAEGMTDGVYHGGPTEALKRACVEAVRLPSIDDRQSLVPMVARR